MKRERSVTSVFPIEQIFQNSALLPQMTKALSLLGPTPAICHEKCACSDGIVKVSSLQRV